MDYFKGTYSFFRYPNDRLVGFSPFLGYLNVKSGFLRKAFDMKRTSLGQGSGGYPYIEQLVDEIFHSVQGNLTATINPRKPIYIIAKSGLLNEFIIHVMMNNIEEFKNNHQMKLIETHVQEYKQFLNCECNKNKTEDKCKKINSCIWSYLSNVGCQLNEKTSEIKNNEKKFKKKLKNFFELINNCINNINLYIPMYLLGIILMSYWYLIKNNIHDTSEEEYFDEYMNMVKTYIINTEKSLNIEKIDNYISRKKLIELPNPLMMIHARIDNEKYPACFETVLNDFLNLLFYEENGGKFVPEIENINILPSLVEHYNYINNNKLDYTSRHVINNFVELTVNLQNIDYNLYGYEIKSSYKNLLNILNYFLNTKCKNIIELMEKINVIVDRFDQRIGILKLIVKGKIIELNIKPGHSFSKRENNYIEDLIRDDSLFTIFLNFLLLEYRNEIDSDTTFIDLYNMLNKNNIILPFYKYIVESENDIKDLDSNIIINTLIIKKLKFNKFPNFGRFKNIKKIIMEENIIKPFSSNGNQVVSFPEDLEDLSLHNNNIKILPDKISFPLNLKIIDLSYNKLDSLVGISFPNNLISLNLGKNNLISIPSGKCFPDNLEILYLDNNDIKSLFDVDGGSIKFPKKLKVLNLDNNKLTSLPEDISFLDSLEILNLNSNELSSLPENIIFPKSLQILNLGFNKLISLPEGDNGCISFPESLITLDLSYNRLNSLPNGISFPKNLKQLKLNFNYLESLPDSSVFPENLKDLVLYDNYFHSISWEKEFPKNKFPLLKILI